MKSVLILNGPNLNMLGVREPEIYGHATLADVEALCRETAVTLELSVDCRQSNYEGELVTWIQEARDVFDAIVINAGAYTHTSLAIHDALKTFEGPVVEVHLSDPKQRESFRHHSYIELVAVYGVAGKGPEGYVDGLRYLAGAL